MPSRRKIWLLPAVLSLAVLLLWIFPALWYTERGEGQPVWFSEQTEIPGWTYEPIPIAESAERVLVADRTFNGEFRSGRENPIRVFSAKRYIEKSNEIGLFVHTPDRCWVESGWKIEPVSPDLQEITLHGVQLKFERRLFQFGRNQELVYFCGLVGGQPLPYRLDHNLSVGVRTALQSNQVRAGTLARITDSHFWRRLGHSFTSRRQLSGPKQFIRISTPVRGEDLVLADQRLRDFLAQWLFRGDFEQERASFQVAASR